MAGLEESFNAAFVEERRIVAVCNRSCDCNCDCRWVNGRRVAVQSDELVGRHCEVRKVRGAFRITPGSERIVPSSGENQGIS